jgi:hypothetical protein
MSCGGGHLGFPIVIKKSNLVKDIPMGKMFQNACHLKPLAQLKPNCPGMIIGMSFTKLLFFMPIGNPRWPPPQDIVQVVSEKKHFETFFP